MEDYFRPTILSILLAWAVVWNNAGHAMSVSALTKGVLFDGVVLHDAEICDMLEISRPAAVPFENGHPYISRPITKLDLLLLLAKRAYIERADVSRRAAKGLVEEDMADLLS
jgi:hypothetical protein